jgi:AraC-like DNA-binding protein
MRYSEHPVAPRHQPWVAYFWHFVTDPAAGELDHWIPPDGGMIVSYRLGDPGAMLTGPQLAPLQVLVRGGEVYWGIRFWPGTAPALLPVEAPLLRDRTVPLATVDPEWDRRVAAALATVREAGPAVERLGGLVDDLLPPRRELDGAVMQGVFRLLRSAGGEPVPAVARAAGLSPEQFRRRFRRAVGLTPKELARIRRFREAAIEAVLAPPQPWVELAAEHGYADQAHLIHEFRRLIGLSPESFRREFRRIAHGTLERRGARGDRFLQDRDEPKG